ncbi:hypothetical protein ACJX0J_032065, partial [Zea mays]
GTMQFKDAASAARAAAESAERATSAAKAAADFVNNNNNNHPFDEDEDCKASTHEFTHTLKRHARRDKHHWMLQFLLAVF